MRIAYFMDTYRLGGAERFLADVVAGVVDAGHQVKVFSPQGDLLELVGESAHKAQLIRTRVDFSAATARRARATALARCLPELRTVLSRARADVLHVNNGGHPGSDLNRLAVIVARYSGAPRCVLSIHNPAESRARSQRQLQALSDWLVWRSVDAVHASSAFVARSMSIRGMPPALCTHIPYGVHEPRASSDADAELRARLAPDGGVLLGLVAATGKPHKGHELFAEALASSGTDARAVIVGPHPGDAFVALLDRLGLGERVVLEGPVQSGDVGQYVRVIDALVVPSTAYESLPLVILEAMAAGKPVFASTLAGIPEAVVDGKTGRLFPIGDVDRLTALLREAAFDPESLQQFGQAGHQRWARHFSVAAMTEGMLALYEELLAGETRRQS